MDKKGHYKDWAISIALILMSGGAFVLIPRGEKTLLLAKKPSFSKHSIIFTFLGV